jgi:uncharacterized protein YbbC (DUF1343 family)
VAFTPAERPYHQHRCEGVRLRVADRGAFNEPGLGIELAAALNRLYPGKFNFGGTLGMLGSRAVLNSIKCGEDPRAIEQQLKAKLDMFNRVRAKYLLY